jgi:hypothetical protein
MSNTKNQTQYVPSTGIFNSALNTAYNVAHTIGEKTQQVAEKVGLYYPAEPKYEEFNKYVDPLASPKDLVLIKSQLKHVQTVDKSKPVIDKDIHILKNHHKALFAEIKQQHELKHVKKTRDASSPFLDKNMKIKESPQKKLFAEIVQPHQLKKVAVNDRSAPVISRDIHITIGAPTTGGLWTAGKEKISSAYSTAKQVAHTMGETLGLYATERKPQFVNPYVSPTELTLVKTGLKHVQTSESRPFFDKDVHILKNNHGALFAEIRQPHELKHVEKTRDSSSPIIDKDLHINKNQHRELFSELQQPHPLSHVSISHDASRPFIEKDIHIRETAQKKVLDAGAATLNYALNTAKQAAHTLGEKTQQAAHTVGEKNSTSRSERWRKNPTSRSYCRRKNSTSRSYRCRKNSTSGSLP